MDFDFTVGDCETHKVHFHFDQMWGALRITVDDKAVVKDFRLYSWNLTNQYALMVGNAERHAVVIEKTRKRFNGSLRRQTYIKYSSMPSLCRRVR